MLLRLTPEKRPSDPKPGPTKVAKGSYGDQVAAKRLLKNIYGSYPTDLLKISIRVDNRIIKGIW